MINNKIVMILFASICVNSSYGRDVADIQSLNKYKETTTVVIEESTNIAESDVIFIKPSGADYGVVLDWGVDNVTTWTLKRVTDAWLMSSEAYGNMPVSIVDIHSEMPHCKAFERDSRVYVTQQEVTDGKIFYRVQFKVLLGTNEWSMARWSNSMYEMNVITQTTSRSPSHLRIFEINTSKSVDSAAKDTKTRNSSILSDRIINNGKDSSRSVKVGDPGR